LSGSGLIYEFLRDAGYGAESPVAFAAMREVDPAAVVSEYGLENQCSLCVAALDLIISIYGAAAGNVALTFMAVSGMYIGGGIAPKIGKKLILCRAIIALQMAALAREHLLHDVDHMIDIEPEIFLQSLQWR
jgi:glucokinase